MKQYMLLGFLLCSLLSCSHSQSKQQAEQLTWQSEYEMIAPDSSFSATIDYLPQGTLYDERIFRLGITPLKIMAADTLFHTKSMGKTCYYYGSVSIQGSMGNCVYVFADEFYMGIYVFFDADYILTFPQTDFYEPSCYKGKDIHMVVTKSTFD